MRLGSVTVPCSPTSALQALRALQRDLEGPVVVSSSQGEIIQRSSTEPQNELVARVTLVTQLSARGLCREGTDRMKTAS